jgi:hypothetical protein
MIPRRALLILCVLLVAVGLALVPTVGTAKPKPVKPGGFLTIPCPTGESGIGGMIVWYDTQMRPLDTTAGVQDGDGVRFGPAPKRAAFAVVTALDCQPPATTTTVAATTTTADTNLYLTGSGLVTDQGLFLYGDPSIPGVQHCPAGYVVDFAASTFTYPANITVTDYTADFDSIIAVADLDTTGTISWRIVCKQVTA